MGGLFCDLARKGSICGAGGLIWREQSAIGRAVGRGMAGGAHGIGNLGRGKEAAASSLVRSRQAGSGHFCLVPDD